MHVTEHRILHEAILGRFVFIERKNKNPDFLQFVEPTIEKARAALLRLGDDAVLRELETMLTRVL